MAKKPPIYDWDALKTEYVTTDCRQIDLKRKYGVSQRQLTLHSSQEHWQEARAEYRRQTARKAIEAARVRDSKRLEQLSSDILKLAEIGGSALRDPAQLYRYYADVRERYAHPVEGADGNMISERSWTEERVGGKLDTKAYRDLVQSYSRLVDMLRDFYDIPTPTQAEARRIASERLELDKAKAAAAVGTEDEGDTGIVLIPLRGDETGERSGSA